MVWSAVGPSAMVCVADALIQKYFVRFYSIDERMVRVTSAGLQVLPVMSCARTPVMLAGVHKMQPQELS